MKIRITKAKNHCLCSFKTWISLFIFSTLTITDAQAQLVITRTNDPSLAANLSAADVTAASAAFDYAANQLMAMYSDPIHVNITLAAVAGTGTLGQSNSSLIGTYTYAQIRSALINDQTAKPSPDGASSTAAIPVADPYGGLTFYVARGLAKGLGLIASDAVNDGTFTFGAGFTYTYDPLNRAVVGKYDFIGVAFHEITEIMGRVCRLNSSGNGNRPYDIFRFTGSGVQSTNFTDANVYFSVNGGTTNLKGFNANGNGGDIGDWTSGTNDAFNAFGGSGILDSFSAVDTKVMDVIGWDLCITPVAPTLVSANLATICAGASSNLNATSSGNTIRWYTVATGGTNIGTSLSGANFSVLPAGTTIYYAEAFNALCARTSPTRTAVTVTVNQLPIVSTSTTAATICASTSTSISGIGASTYAWNPGALTGTTVNVTPAVTTTYTVTGTAATGCINTTTRLITVNPLPATGTTVTNATICAGGSTSITGTGAATYTWNPGALSGATISVTPATTTTYTVTGTSAAGCVATATRIITVNLLPATGTTVTNATICAGGSTSITGTGAATYTWNPGALSGATISVSPATTTTYTVSGTSAAGCSATATRIITVNTLPTTGTTVTNATICAGGSTSITGTGAATYTWNPGALSGATISVTSATTTTYTVTGTSAAGCVATATRLITVNTLPIVGTTVTSASICSGTSTSITGTGAATYTWNPGALSGATISVSPTTTTTYTVIGTNASGCNSTATRTITVTTCGGSTLNLKLYIQGYYLSGGLMAPAMLNQGVAGATTTKTDTIQVELRNTTSPYAIASTLKTILNANGTAVCNFPITGTYYLAIKHRNGLQTWSAAPVILNATPGTYDFSNLISKAYGSNQVAMGGGVFAFYSGDINQDENMDLLDSSLMESSIQNFASGYYATDINGDGNVDLLDSPILDDNITNFVSSNHP